MCEYTYLYLFTIAVLLYAYQSCRLGDFMCLYILLCISIKFSNLFAAIVNQHYISSFHALVCISLLTCILICHALIFNRLLNCLLRSVTKIILILSCTYLHQKCTAHDCASQEVFACSRVFIFPFIN